ncbi:hypothetical protein F5887DRAFT_929705, partial [Amanita rubescens]
MFTSTAGRKPHIRKEMTTVSSKGVSKGRPIAHTSRPASNSPVYSPFEAIEMPLTPAVPQQAVSAIELSGWLQSVAAEGVLARDEVNPQQELDKEREVAALASPNKIPYTEMLLETSQASHTVRQASEALAEPMSHELIAMTALFKQILDKQDGMNNRLINQREDMMNILRFDVAKPLARLAERESSCSRSSSRASMTSRGCIRNDEYTPLRYCPLPHEAKGKEPAYSQEQEYDDARSDQGQQHNSVLPVTQDELMLDAIDAKLAALVGPQELEVLVVLKRNEILHGITKGLLNFERYRRDRDEAEICYNEWITKNTKLLLLAALNARNPASFLIHKLTLPFKRETRFEPQAHIAQTHPEQGLEPEEAEP